MRYSLIALSLCVALAACQKSNEPAASAQPAEVDATRLAQADKDTSNWLTVGRTYDEQRFSPLDKINTTNVSQLGLAWSLDLDTHRGQEATPIVIDGVMYSSSAWSKVQAIDAATGKLLWQFDPQVPGDWAINACCDVVNRGVAFWQGKVYVGTLDGRLIAIDAKSGKQLWSTLTIDPSKKAAISGAPRIVKGKVLIGSAGAEYDARGYLAAYDADTGKELWRFYTVPGDPSKPFEKPILEQAAKTWKGEWWKLGGGGTVWDAMAYDPELDLLYFGTGNGLPWNQKQRSPGGGDNLFIASIIAIKPDTGDYVWHYQETPGEEWDYDATQHIVLSDITIDNQPRKVLMQASKNGFFYVIDRTDGKFISAKPFATVNWATGINPNGRPIENPDARKTDNPKKPWTGLPGGLGAHTWKPMSFSPQTNLVYIPVNEGAFVYSDDKNYKPRATRGMNTGYDFTVGSMPQGDAKLKTQILSGAKGFLRAWDPIAQKEIWSVEYPGLWNGGVLSTAGGLVFEGTAMGFFNAYDARTGKQLWSTSAQTGVIAAPMSYSVNGEQYIAVVAGWGGVFPLVAGDAGRKGTLRVNNSRVLAFKLGGTQKLPEAIPPVDGKPIPRVGSDADVAKGFALFHSYCGDCHGDSVVGGGIVPDLRWSPMALSAEAWKSVVLDGARKDRGMVSFAPALNEKDAEYLRAYVTMRSNQVDK
jgi:quinohemoprotein ethanol dehydrogenase